MKTKKVEQIKQKLKTHILLKNTLYFVKIISCYLLLKNTSRPAISIISAQQDRKKIEIKKKISLEIFDLKMDKEKVNTHHDRTTVVLPYECWLSLAEDRKSK